MFHSKQRESIDFTQSNFGVRNSKYSPNSFDKDSRHNRQRTMRSKNHQSKRLTTLWDPLNYSPQEQINIRRYRSKSLMKLDLNFNESPINVNDESAVKNHQMNQTDENKIGTQFTFGQETNNQRYLSMHHLQTERKKERKAENQLKIIQLEVEDDIDGQTNGRQRERVPKMAKNRQVDVALNTSGSLDLCDSSIRSQSIRNIQALKEMSAPHLNECHQHSQQKSFLLKNLQMYDPDEFHQYAKYHHQRQKQYGVPPSQMIDSAQNHINQFHFEDQQEGAPQLQIHDKSNQTKVMELAENNTNLISDNYPPDEVGGLRRDGLKSSFAQINIHQFNELIR